MTENVVEMLEDMRYKYLSMKYDGMPKSEEAIQDLIGDMIFIIHVLKKLLDPLEDSHQINGRTNK